MHYGKLWSSLATVIGIGFVVLGYFGGEIYRQAPPVPERVVTTAGTVLFSGQDIRRGQNVWQSLGGQEIGSIWGHGAYQAPDWSSDWLHRECVFVLDRWAREQGAESYAKLDAEGQGALRARLQRVMRSNTYDETAGAVTLDPVRAEAFGTLAAHYADVFGKGRHEYAIPEGTLTDAARARDMAAFFW